MYYDDYECDSDIQRCFASHSILLASDRSEDYERVLEILNENKEILTGNEDFGRTNISVDFDIVEDNGKKKIIVDFKAENEYYDEDEDYSQDMKDYPVYMADNIMEFLHDKDIDFVEDVEIINAEYYDSDYDYEHRDEIKAKALKEKLLNEARITTSIMPDIEFEDSTQYSSHKKINICFDENGMNGNSYISLEENLSNDKEFNITARYTIRYYNPDLLLIAINEDIDVAMAKDIYANKDDLNKCFEGKGIRSLFSQEDMRDIKILSSFEEIDKAIDYAIVRNASNEENQKLINKMCSAAREDFAALCSINKELDYEKGIESLESCKAPFEVSCSYSRFVKSHEQIIYSHELAKHKNFMESEFDNKDISPLIKLNSMSEEYAKLCEALSCIKNVTDFKAVYARSREDKDDCYKYYHDYNYYVSNYDSLGDLLAAFSERPQNNITLGVNKEGNLMIKVVETKDYDDYYDDSYQICFKSEVVRINPGTITSDYKESHSKEVDEKFQELFRSSEQIDIQLLSKIVKETVPKMKKETVVKE